jgi:hypothetical protein
MSNLLKSPVVVKPNILLHNDVYPFRKTHIYLQQIIPTTIVKNKNAFEIIYINESMWLNGFSITTYTKDDFVMCINVFGEHPNVDPNTNTYCLAEHKKKQKLDLKFLSLLFTNLKTYYYDSAYFIPDKKLVDYKKLKSIYIQMNQGE